MEEVSAMTKRREQETTTAKKQAGGIEAAFERIRLKHPDYASLDLAELVQEGVTILRSGQ